MKIPFLFDLVFTADDLSNPIPVRITPQASKNEVRLEHLPDGHHRVRISVTCPAEHGKANQAMLKLLAQALDTPVSTLSLVRGFHHRDKSVAWKRPNMP